MVRSTPGLAGSLVAARQRTPAALLSSISALVVLASCTRQDGAGAASASTSGGVGADPCAVALAAESGPETAELGIERLQVEARQSESPGPALERLGWSYVAAARRTYDQGWYGLAQQAALCLETRQPGSLEALLLRGHVLHNLHRFREMETLARELVRRRGSAFDRGLLGDALLEQGQVEAAIGEYQAMVDLKPSLQAYSRVSHVRWLRGDLQGAVDAMRLAIDAGSRRDPESLAWGWSRLASYHLQAGDLEAAREASDTALEIDADHAPSLLVRGQILLATDRTVEALEPLARAAHLNPLPEFQWAAADALREAGREADARKVEARLLARGESEDPRTFALYLASRRERVPTAVALAERELRVRADVHTLDVLAWALAAAGRLEEAQQTAGRALAEGTPDARFFYHAGAIAADRGRPGDARAWFAKASTGAAALYPSERADLGRRTADLD